MIVDDVFKSPVLREISQLISLLSLQRDEIFQVQKEILTKDKNISNHDLKFLLFIARSQEPSIHELADTLGIKSSTVSIRLNNLEKHGYIRRELDELDKRKKFIKMEKKGCSTIKNLTSLIKMENNHFIKALNHLDNNEQDNLVSIITKVNNYLKELMEVDNLQIEMRTHLQQFLGFK